MARELEPKPEFPFPLMRHCECSRPLCEKESSLANTRSLLCGQEEEEEEDKRKIDCCGTNLSRRGEFSVLILVLGNKAGRRQSVCLCRALDYLTDGRMGCSFHECKWCYPKSGITYGDDRKQSQCTAENKTHTEEALERSSVARGIQAGADTYTSRLDRVTAQSGWVSSCASPATSEPLLLLLLLVIKAL